MGRVQVRTSLPNRYSFYCLLTFEGTLLILPLTSGIRLLPHLQVLDVIMLQRSVHPCVVIICTAQADCPTVFACYRGHAYGIRNNSNRTMKLVAFYAAYRCVDNVQHVFRRNIKKPFASLAPNYASLAVWQSIRVHGSQVVPECTSFCNGTDTVK